jgi:ATP-dependent Clp protease adaptor protein ClpS
MTQTDVVVNTDTVAVIAKPNKWAVIVHNDDVTPMDFVVELLVQVFRHTRYSASDLTNQVHTSNKAVAGIYSHEIAEEKYNTAVSTIKLNGYVLKLTLEEQN